MTSLSTFLARAQGIVLLLSSDAEARLEKGDTLHPIYIANALGAVWGLLNQAEAVILHSIIKPSGCRRELKATER